MGRLTSQVAVVTGGASGIGGEITRVFAREGAAVEVLDLGPLPDDLTSDVDIRLHGVDVSDEDGVRRSLADIHERRGRIDIVVNAAGICTATPFLR